MIQTHRDPLETIPSLASFYFALWGLGAEKPDPLVVGRQVLVPQGVCNGYQSITHTQYVYCFDAEWQPGMSGIAVSALDPELGIDWPVPIDGGDRAQISEKDAGLPTFAEATGQTAAR